MKICFRLGNLMFELRGDGPLASAAREEIPAQMLCENDGPADVVYEFGNINIPSGDSVYVGAYRVGKGWIYIDDKYLPSLISMEAGRMHVTVGCRVDLLGKPGISALLKPVDHAYNNVWGRISKRFYYSIFNQTSQLYQLAHGQTYCHASACTDGQRTVLLMAWGGVGKTSSLLQLLNSSESWRFISDDQAVLDRKGSVYRTPFRMQIYPYNLEGEDRLRAALMGRRSLFDKAQWQIRQRLMGKKSVRRRVQAEEFQGAGRGAASAPVTHAFFLRRTGGTEFADHSVSTEDLALQMSHVMHYELGMLGNLLAASTSVGSRDEGFGFDMTIASELDAVADIVRAGLGHMRAQPTLLDVPFKAQPADLLQAVLARID